MEKKETEIGKDNQIAVSKSRKKAASNASGAVVSRGGRKEASGEADEIISKSKMKAASGVRDAVVQESDCAEVTEEEKNRRVEDALFQLAISGNISALTFWLKNRMPHRWRERQEAGECGEGVLPELLQLWKGKSTSSIKRKC